MQKSKPGTLSVGLRCGQTQVSEWPDLNSFNVLNSLIYLKMRKAHVLKAFVKNINMTEIIWVCTLQIHPHQKNIKIAFLISQYLIYLKFRLWQCIKVTSLGDSLLD